MPMQNQGRAKLTEECGELLQVLGKIMQYPNTDEHPDGKGSLRIRLQEEMADVYAALEFVALKMKLDHNQIDSRKHEKLTLFWKWDSETEER